MNLKHTLQIMRMTVMMSASKITVVINLPAGERVHDQEAI